MAAPAASAFQQPTYSPPTITMPPPAGGAGLLFEGEWALDPGFIEDEVLPCGRLLVGRDPLVDQVRHRTASVRRNGADPSSDPVINHHRI